MVIDKESLGESHNSRYSFIWELEYIKMLKYCEQIYLLLWRYVMKINTIKENNVEIAIVKSSEILIEDVQSALDFMATVRYETGCDRIILNKSAICEEFFNLSTKLAGDILQKFINYHVKIAIVGDFSVYTSKSLKAFIYESNNGKDIFFMPDEKQAIGKLSI
jgi:hypothetical protein